MSIQQTFKALGDPTRRGSLESLSHDGRRTAGQLGEGLGLTGATISHHLACLKDAGLVSDQREGKYIYYELDTSVFEELMRWAASFSKEGDHGETL